MNFNWDDNQLEVLFYSFLRTNGIFSGGCYILTTTLKRWEEKINEMFLKFYLLKIEPIRTKTLLKYKICDKEFIKIIIEKFGKVLIEDHEEIKAYISGLFLGKGWISSLNSKNYHFEIRVRTLDHSLDVQEVFDEIGIKTITIKKNKWFYTYIKKTMDISNSIKAMNAYKAVINFEDVRIERDFISTYKKMNTIEKVNLDKIAKTFKKHQMAIKKLNELDFFKKINSKYKKISILRLQNPYFSLSELQMKYNQIYNENISRSTINNWLNEIIKLSQSEEKNE